MPADNSFPEGTIEQLLQTDAVSAATREAIRPRLYTKAATPVFFDRDSFSVMTIICNHLMALEGDYPSVNIAMEIDSRLAAGHSNGWRYQQMPNDRSVYTKALQGINETAEMLYHASFADISPENQAAVLQRIQKGLAAGETWKQLKSTLFFEELLAEVTEIFYSYPYAQNEIGYMGMADVHGLNKQGYTNRKKNQWNNTIIQAINFHLHEDICT